MLRCVGTIGGTRVRGVDRNVRASREVTGRMRTATEDLFVAEAPAPYCPVTMRARGVPHAGRGSIVRLDDERLAAVYNPKCDDGFAMFCEQVGLVPLERSRDGRLRQPASVITQASGVAAPQAPVTRETMREPPVTRGGDGVYHIRTCERTSARTTLIR